MRRDIILFFLVIITTVSCTRSLPEITREEVMNTLNRFDRGWENKNLKAVDSVLAPAYVYFTQSGSTFSRDSVVATAGELDYLLYNMSRSEYVITLYENTAVVSTRWKGKGMYRGSPFDEDQRCSIVLIKKNDKVEILSEHCTPVRQNRIFH